MLLFNIADRVYVYLEPKLPGSWKTFVRYDDSVYIILDSSVIQLNNEGQIVSATPSNEIHNDCGRIQSIVFEDVAYFVPDNGEIWSYNFTTKSGPAKLLDF
jgi:hypothetical protein